MSTAPCTWWPAVVSGGVDVAVLERAKTPRPSPTEPPRTWGSGGSPGSAVGAVAVEDRSPQALGAERGRVQHGAALEELELAAPSPTGRGPRSGSGARPGGAEGAVAGGPRPRRRRHRGRRVVDVAALEALDLAAVAHRHQVGHRVPQLRLRAAEPEAVKTAPWISTTGRRRRRSGPSGSRRTASACRRWSHVAVG